MVNLIIFRLLKIVQFAKHLFSVDTHFQYRIPEGVEIDGIAGHRVVFLESFMILKDEAYGGQLFADLGVLGIFFQHLLEAEACVLEHAELEAVVAYFHPGICFGGIAES